MKRLHGTTTFFAAIFFFLSGCAALIYQTAWQRLLSLFAGSDSQAIGIIIAAFMVGLGVGHLIGGRLADQLQARQNIACLALLEIALALFGYFSPWLYHDILCLQLGAITEFRFTSSVLLFVLLLPPTLVMGMSLPLLMRGLAHDLAHAPSLTGLLYGINTLGASAGALITPWLLFPIWGIAGSLKVAATLNVLCSLGLLTLSFRRQQSAGENTTEAPEHDLTQPAPDLAYLPFLFGCSGFLALGLEMVWFRALGVVIKSTAFTFGTLLSLFLLDLGAGSIAGIWLAKKTRHPLSGFLLAQSLLAAYAGLSFICLIQALEAGWLPSPIHSYLGGYEPLDLSIPQADLTATQQREWLTLSSHLYLVLPLLMMGPPTFLMGLSFPLFQKTVQQNMSSLGRTLGNCQTANIAGSALGALAVNFILIPPFGSAGTLAILVSLGLIFMLARSSFRKAIRLVLALSLVIITAALPGQNRLWAALHGTSVDQIIITEDSSGIAAVKRTIPNNLQPWDTAVHVNGIGQSWAPYGGIHTILGALPALLHPRPETIALIGLGSGDTAYAAAPRYETQKLTCIEIISGLHQALQQETQRNPKSAIAAMLDDTRIQHTAGDGRRFLMATPQRFDIIEADALRPNSTGAGNLYSEEYFRLIASKLKPGGYAVTWIPTERVRRTFHHVFPHILDFKTFAIGSPDPITCTAHDLRRRIGHLEVRQHFRTIGLDIQQLLTPFTQLNFDHLKHSTQPHTDINTDLFPKDEFELQALWGSRP